MKWLYEILEGWTVWDVVESVCLFALLYVVMLGFMVL